MRSDESRINDRRSFATICVCVCARVQERVRPLLSQYTRHKMRSVIFIPLRHQTYHLLTTRSSSRASSLRESISLMCLHLPFDNLHQTLLQIYRIELKVLEMINDLGTARYFYEMSSWKNLSHVWRFNIWHIFACKIFFRFEKFNISWRNDKIREK